jgi:hypothetical protein
VNWATPLRAPTTGRLGVNYGPPSPIYRHPRPLWKIRIND